MNDGAVNVVCIYQFREGPGKHTPRPSYDILVGENWVPWQGHDPPVLLENAVIRTAKYGGGRYAVPAESEGRNG